MMSNDRSQNDWNHAYHSFLQVSVFTPMGILITVQENQEFSNSKDKGRDKNYVVLFSLYLALPCFSC